MKKFIEVRTLKRVSSCIQSLITINSVWIISYSFILFVFFLKIWLTPLLEIIKCSSFKSFSSKTTSKFYGLNTSWEYLVRFQLKFDICLFLCLAKNDIACFLVLMSARCLSNGISSSRFLYKIMKSRLPFSNYTCLKSYDTSISNTNILIVYTLFFLIEYMVIISIY